MAGLGIFGASLFVGDSMITPAISVLSAVEGLKVASPSLDHLIVPVTAAIIVALFMIQRLGTAAVGRLFGGRPGTLDPDDAALLGHGVSVGAVTASSGRGLGREERLGRLH
jgi:hypothetical protein